MTAELLQQHWALVIGSVLALAIALFVLLRVLGQSRRGRFAKALGDLRERERALGKASDAADKAAARLSRLSAKGDSIAPNKLLAAKDALVGAQEEEKLLREQVLVVRNNARTIILDEFPPKRHESLLRRHLGETR
jgi:hypothetical protein